MAGRQGDISSVENREIAETEEIRETEQQVHLEELLDATLDGIFQLDMQGCFLYVNHAFAQIVGLPIHNIIGRSGTELALPIAPDVSALNETTQFVEVELATPRGMRHYEYTLSPVSASDGTIKALAGVLHDIEKRKRTEQELSKFFSLASHELRTPLAAIKGNVQLALRQVRRLIKLDAPGANEFAYKIEGMLHNAERQTDVESRMVGDILDVSRIQNNRLEIHPHPCNLVDIVTTVIDSTRALEPKRELSLTLSAHDTLTVEADPERIEQILHNYLSNALKYAPPELPINVSVEANSEQVRVSVRDEGPGLTDEEQEHVWDRFYQTPDRMVLNGQSTGLGLGLYINKVLIERQHGSVGVESEKGQGATFWFTLPLIHDNEL